MELKPFLITYVPFLVLAGSQAPLVRREEANPAAIGPARVASVPLRQQNHPRVLQSQRYRKNIPGR